MAQYDFHNVTTRTAGYSNRVPRELWKAPEEFVYGGLWIYQVVPGFHTLGVSGRELLNYDIHTYDVGTSTYYREKKKQSRTITIQYQLNSTEALERFTNASDRCYVGAEKAATMTENDAFRESYNLLNYYLNQGSEKNLWFADEEDKYFTATKATNSQVKTGRNNVTGELSFFCTDPLKYSRTTKTFTAQMVPDPDEPSVSSNIITIVNDGTVSVPISYEVTINSNNSTDDCGFVGLASSSGVLQYGLVEEVDKEKKTKSVVKSNQNTGAKLLSNYANSNTSSMEFTKAGSYESRELTNATGTFMVPSSYGSGDAWHGPARSLTLDAAYKNFKCEAVCMFDANRAYRLGIICISLNDANGDTICDIHLNKWENSSWRAYAYCRVTGAEAEETVEFSTEQIEGAPFSRVNSPAGGRISITKSNAKFIFNIAGTTRTINLAAAKNKTVKSITLWSCRYGDKTAMSAQGWKSVKFTANNVTYWYDVPNRYTAGDVLEINGLTGKMYLNQKDGDGHKTRTNETGDEVVGSVHFKAPPGTSYVYVAQSDWAAPVSAEATIREAWY